MAGIVRHAGGEPRPHRSSPPNRAPSTLGRDVDASEWQGTVLDFADLGAVLPRGGSELFCEAAVLLRGARRRPDGSYFRRRLGWRAERSRVVVVHCDQNLRPRPDGRFEPVGGWSVTDVNTFEAADVSRRVGSVPHDPHPSGDGASQVASGPQPTRRDDSALGRDEQDLSYLPSAVRSGVLRAVASPAVACAEAVQFSSDEGPTHHQVVALRLDARGGIAVQGSRQARASTWQVEQLRYTWSESRATLSQGGAPGRSLA